MDALGWTLVALVGVPSAISLGKFLFAWFARHPVQPYATGAAPPPPGPYAAEMVESATLDFGFRWIGAAPFARFPKLAATVLRAPDGSAIAYVVCGMRRRTPTAYTTLVSRFADGRELATSDVDLPPLDPSVRQQHLLSADFAELWQLHRATLADRAAAEAALVPFAETFGWDDVAEDERASVARRVALGRVRYVDADRYRFRLRGLLRLKLGEFTRGVLHPPDAKRVYRRRPGGAQVLAEAVEVAAATDGSTPEANLADRRD